MQCGDKRDATELYVMEPYATEMYSTEQYSTEQYATEIRGANATED